MSQDLLTPNGILRFFNPSTNTDTYKPTVQINAIKKCGAGGGANKNKLLVSDGAHFTTMLSVGDDIDKVIADDTVKKNAIVKIERYNVTSSNNKHFVLILEVAILSYPEQKIGNPMKLTDEQIQGEVNKTTSVNSVSSTVSTYSTGGMAGATPSGTPGNIYPIQSLNPYQNKWTIKARVTKKSDIRTWSNARGEGKLFSLELMDESGEIRCTGFTEAVDKFYNLVEQDYVYYISRCSLKTANKQYTAIKNDYEMTINSDTTIVKCEEVDTGVPQIKLDFTKISDLESCENNSFVDIIGIATDMGDVQSLTARSSGKQLTKREVKLQDRSGAAVSLTLWGNDAEKFDTALTYPVISVKAAKVSDFGGRSLSVSFNSTLQVNPDNEVSHELKGWYESSGKNETVRQMSSSQGMGGGGSMETAHKTFVEVKEAKLQDKPEYFSNNAAIVFVKKDNCMYQACPSSDCNKKVMQESATEYRCEKCDKLYPNYKYRLMLTVKLSDFTGNEWVTCFQETAEKLLGITAEELGKLKESNETEFDQAMNKVNFSSYNFKIRARLETYMDESRLKCTALSVEPIDCLAHSKRLLDEIKALEG